MFLLRNKKKYLIWSFGGGSFLIKSSSEKITSTKHDVEYSVKETNSFIAEGGI